MELKKSPKANIERYRALFFQIGLIITLGIVLAAFEWNTKQKTFDEDIFQGNDDGDVIEILPVTHPEQQRASTPVPPISHIFNPVPDYIPFGEENIEIPGIGEIGGTSSKIDIGPIGEIGPPEEIYIDPQVDLQAEFMGGGTDRFCKWVADHTIFPEVAIENGIKGKVTVKFVIDKKGNLTKIDILRSEDPSFEAEVIRVLRMSPQWKPAIRKNKPVSISYIIPVNFSFK